MRITQAEYEILATCFSQYKQALSIASPALRVRLLVSMVNLVGGYNLPTDVLEEFDSRIADAYDCAIIGEEFSLEAPRVLYTGFDGVIVVDSLATYGRIYSYA